MTDEQYMKMALELAEKGEGCVNPNPMVGAVIVKDGEIIGSGWHERCGQLHAERNALANCKQSAEGGTIYVTLEPCCHYGRTPPCTEAIIENKLKRVVIGSSDPNPLVAGKGVEILRSHGIEVLTGVLKEECDRINEIFLHFITEKMPFVMMKYAMTIDGKIASSSGKSKWITGETARENVHKDRNKFAAIMVGSGTVLEDNPMLNCRLEGGRNPIRIVCDTRLRTPLDCDLVKTANEIPLIIATCEMDKYKIKSYTDLGCQVIILPQKNNHIDLKILMDKLAQMKIDSILLEGGGTLNWSCLENGIVSKVQAYIAPKILGGESAKTPVGGVGADSPNDAIMLTDSKIRKIGDDFLIESKVIKKCSQE